MLLHVKFIMIICPKNLERGCQSYLSTVILSRGAKLLALNSIVESMQGTSQLELCDTFVCYDSTLLKLYIVEIHRSILIEVFCYAKATELVACGLSQLSA